MLPKDIAKLVPKTHLMSESEWRNLGVQQSQGWVHYMIHEPGRCNGRFTEGMLDPITHRLRGGGVALLVSYPTCHIENWERAPVRIRVKCLGSSETARQ